jgi:hypothetical protein
MHMWAFMHVIGKSCRPACTGQHSQGVGPRRVEEQRLSGVAEQAAERERDVERERRGDTAAGSTAANSSAAQAAASAAMRTPRKLSNAQIQKMLPELDKSLQMQAAARVFTRALRAALRRHQSAGGSARGSGLVWRALARVLWGGLLRAVALYLGHMLCGVATPLVCWTLLLWMQQEDPPLASGLLLVCALGLCSGLSATLKVVE